MTVVEAPERPVVSVDVEALEKAKEEILKAPHNSLDNLVDGLQEEVNKTSKYHQQWSPHTPGTHDYIHGGLSLFAWLMGTILVLVFLRVTYKKGQARLAVQQVSQPAPVQFVAGQGVILPPRDLLLSLLLLLLLLAPQPLLVTPAGSLQL